MRPFWWAWSFEGLMMGCANAGCKSARTPAWQRCWRPCAQTYTMTWAWPQRRGRSWNNYATCSDSGCVCDQEGSYARSHLLSFASSRSAPDPTLSQCRWSCCGVCHMSHSRQPSEPIQSDSFPHSVSSRREVGLALLRGQRQCLVLVHSLKWHECDESLEVTVVHYSH